MRRSGWGIGVGAIALLVGACYSDGIVKIAPDTYRLTRADSGGRFADAAAMKASVIDEANAFAGRQGKIAVPVSTHEETMAVGHLSTIKYEFRLAAPGQSGSSPAAPPPAAPPQPVDAAAIAGSGSAADVPPGAKSETKPDLYTELIKLDDLRKRGIITEDEFQALKAKLLAGK